MKRIIQSIDLHVVYLGVILSFGASWIGFSLLKSTLPSLPLRTAASFAILAVFLMPMIITRLFDASTHKEERLPYLLGNTAVIVVLTAVTTVAQLLFK
jgi:hypothetical protein